MFVYVLQPIQQNGPQQEANQAVQTLAEVAASHQDVPQVIQGNVAVEVADQANQGVATLAEATINADGQLILTGDTSAFSGRHSMSSFSLAMRIEIYFLIN